MGRILVEIANKRWTMQAMHLASAMARGTDSDVVLLHLLRVSNPMLLGSPVGYNPPGNEEHLAIKEYLMIVEDYGVDATVHMMQYESRVDAIVQAADELGVSVVFAQSPDSRLSLVRKLQVWNLQHQLSAQKCALYTIDELQGLEHRVTAVSFKAAR